MIAAKRVSAAPDLGSGSAISIRGALKKGRQQHTKDKKQTSRHGPHLQPTGFTIIGIECLASQTHAQSEHFQSNPTMNLFSEGKGYPNKMSCQKPHQIHLGLEHSWW